MAETQYTSTLTGPELDEALRDAASVDAKVQQAQSAAQQAAQSASSAQSYASQASGSASTASSAASTATSKAQDAQTAAGQAAGSASQAAQSAASIAGSVSAAQSAAEDAETAKTDAESAKTDAQTAASQAQGYLAAVQSNAQAAQTAAGNAENAKQAAAGSASQAASSASTASAAAQTITDNLEAIQAAPAAASAAQTAAQSAQAAQEAAEDAAERAEQIADFNPADFATSAQGTKADTAVQSVNGKSGTAVTLTPADIGAATAAQGAKADTAVQSVNGAKPDSSGNVQLDLTTGTVRSVNGKDPDGSGNVQLSAGDVGAATAAQGAKADTALQPGALTGYAQTSDIPSKLPNPQSLGIRLGQYGSTTYYDGGAAKTITITPEAIGAQPAGASSGGELTLLYNNKSVTTLNPGEMIRFNAAGYDAIGIVSRHRASDDFYSPMQIVEFNNEPYTTCMLYAVGMDSRYGPEISAREVSVASGSIVAQDRGYYYNWSAHEADDGACIPVQVWGIKF